MKWRLTFLPDAVCEYGGITMRELYRDADKFLEGAKRCREKCLSLYGYDLTNFALHMPSYEVLTPFGVTVIYPENAEPMPIEGVLKNLDDVKNFQIPEFLKTKEIQFFVEKRNRMNSKSERKVSFPVGVNGVATPAKILRGQPFFTDFYDNPGGFSYLLSFITDVEIAYTKEMSMFEGLPINNGASIWDDIAGMFPPDIYGKFFVSHYQKIKETFKGPIHYYHCEEMRKDHLKFLKEFDVELFDYGWDRYLSAEILLENTDVNFTYNFNYIRDIKQSTPDKIQKLYKDRVKIGSPFLKEMKMDIPSHVPPENIRALIEVALEYENF